MKEQIEYFDIKQAAKYAGFDTTYMVDYLCREELIFPTAEKGRGRGRMRLFSFKDLLVLKIYRKMLEAGVSVKKLKAALRESKEFQSLRVTRDRRRVGWKEANLLIANAEKIYIRADASQFIQSDTGGQLVFSFMVSLKDLHEELSRKTHNVVHYRKREKGDGFRRFYPARNTDSL